MRAIIERHINPSPDLQSKLEQSKRAAESQELRTIRCPRCGFYMLDVYGYEHYLVRVKCRKCKFDETIDTALFRTMKTRKYRRRAAGLRD